MSLPDSERVLHPDEVYQQVRSTGSSIAFDTLSDENILSQSLELNNSVIEGGLERYAKHTVLIDLGNVPRSWIDDQTRAGWWTDDEQLACYRVFKWIEGGSEDYDVDTFTYQTPVRPALEMDQLLRKGPLPMIGDYSNYSYQKDKRDLEKDYQDSIKAYRAIKAGERDLGSQFG